MAMTEPTGAQGAQESTSVTSADQDSQIRALLDQRRQAQTNGDQTTVASIDRQLDELGYDGDR
jgi:hypothetical protein